MGFTRSYYAKEAISKVFHMKTWYGSEPGAIRRVACSRNAGIFVKSTVSKLSFPNAKYISARQHPHPSEKCEVCLFGFSPG